MARPRTNQTESKPAADQDVVVPPPADAEQGESAAEVEGTADEPEEPEAADPVEEPEEEPALPAETPPACAHAWERGRRDGVQTYHCPRCGAHKPR